MFVLLTINKPVIFLRRVEWEISYPTLTLKNVLLMEKSTKAGEWEKRMMRKTGLVYLNCACELEC